MTFQSPFDDAGGAWDALTILASRAGVAEKWEWLETNVDFDGDVTNDWDIQKSQGADGARTKDNGYKPAQFSITWLLWNKVHWSAFEAFVQSAKPRPGKDPKPTIMVVHPLLQVYSLVMFRLEKLHLPKFKAVDQWEARVDVIEYFADPKPVQAPDKPKVRQPTSFTRGPETREPTSFIRDRNPTTFVRDTPGSKVKP